MALQDDPYYQELFDIWDETIYSECGFYFMYFAQLILYHLLQDVLAVS